jgi:hypothetical protein
MRYDINKFYPRDVYGRIALGIASAVLGTIGGAGLYWYWTHLVPLIQADVAVLLIRGLLTEFVLASTLFGACGLLWAVATPHWFEPILGLVTRKFLFVTGIVCLLCCALMIWLMIAVGF